MIENINDILEKPQCSAAHKFIKSGSLEKQQQWWKLYKKTFQDAPPPTKDHILKIKDFYQRELPKNPGRLTTDDLDNHEENLIRLMDDDYLTEAFKALSGFFTSPYHLWGIERKITQNPQLESQQLEDFEQVDNTLLVDRLKYKSKIPQLSGNSIPFILLNEHHKNKYFEKIRNRLANINLGNFTVISTSPNEYQRKDNRQKLTNLIKENIQRAAVLLELYPSRHAIIEAMNSPKKKGSKEKITRIQIFTKAQELKKNGMEVPDMFDVICNWLLDDLGFKKFEIKKRYNISLDDASSFNRLANKHVSHHN